MNKALMGLGLAIAVLGAAYFMRDGVAYRKPEADPNLTWSSTEKRHAPEVVLAISPKATPPKLPHAPVVEKPRLSPAMQEYTSGQPLKSLFDRLRGATSRTPEEDYLLAEILERCGTIAGRGRGAPKGDQQRQQFVASIAEGDPHRERRIAAYDRFNRPRCEGIEVGTSDAEIRALLDKAGAAGDPKARARIVERDVWAAFRGPDGMPVQRNNNNPAINEAQVNALRQAAQSGDPEALLTVGRLFSSTMADLVIRAGPEGRPIDNRVFQDAWILAACEMGLECGADNRTMLYGCAMQGNCDATDLRQYLFYYQHSPQQSQRLYEYQNQIARAIRGGDWSYFTFHRGPPAPGSSYHFWR
jgi:hypothetical protein